MLRKVYGFSQRKVARQLAIAESTVEKHVALGLRRCSERMITAEMDTINEHKRANLDE